MTYRVTVLLGGVITEDVEEFASARSALDAMRVAAPRDYVETLKEWMDGGAHEPLYIPESSAYGDLWEYLP